jgi:hypothetical protein
VQGSEIPASETAGHGEKCVQYASQTESKKEKTAAAAGACLDIAGSFGFSCTQHTRVLRVARTASVSGPWFIAYSTACTW